MKKEVLVACIRDLGLKSPNLNSNLLDEVLRIENVNRGDIDISCLKEAIKLFLTKFKSKFQSCNKTWSRFLEREKKWLEGTFEIKDKVNISGSGRPIKDWNECEERSKQY